MITLRSMLRRCQVAGALGRSTMAGRFLLLLTLLATSSADAAINRCIGHDGNLVYSDRSCESLGIAEHGLEPMPRRRVGDPRPTGRLGFDCAARAPEGLRSAVIDAIDSRDFNALAGLYNFDGRSRQTAAGVVRRLERMAKRPVLEVELIAPEAESLFDVLTVDTTSLPRLRVVQPSDGRNGPLSIENFTIARSAGCVWLAG